MRLDCRVALLLAMTARLSSQKAFSCERSAAIQQIKKYVAKGVVE